MNEPVRNIDNYLDNHYIHRSNWLRAGVLGAFHVDYGAVRKTVRSEGNPAAIKPWCFLDGVARKTERSEGTPGAVTKICTHLISKPCNMNYGVFAFLLPSFKLKK